ncbi:sensor histidine kinase [Lutibacter citreus]|uniref:sensor histidine kinase n=1 Tax=Lutibacter citreus TaxID=2138210 RepID=UPI000DBE4F22|nr:histidine kinase [Lutibacter citreus]
MLKLDKWIDNKIVQNLFIWFFLFLILIITIQGESKALTSIFIILLLAPAIYLNNLFILPFLKKKSLIFFFLFVANTLLFTVISVLLIKTVTNQELELKMFINFIGIMFLALIFASSIKIARDSFIRRQQGQIAELKLLKAQLNPHFLFNTLNNLYGLSVIKSDKLPGLMLKLSDLLRYSLYETKETFSPLEKEIVYLENYIALEKIRLEDKVTINFTKEGEFYSHKIAPMLLIVFVENAFKHLAILKDEKSNVTIHIKKENGKLNFKCSNSSELTSIRDKELEKGKNGIGLNNAIKRLKIMYPEKHKLNIYNNTNKFTVELILEL